MTNEVKNICVEIYRAQEYGVPWHNGSYDLKIPLGQISYFDDYSGKVNSDSISIHTKGNEFKTSRLLSRRIGAVQVPESSLETILTDWKNVVVPSFSKLLALYRANDDARKELMLCPAVINPVLLLSPEARVQVDKPLNSVKQLNMQIEQVGRSRETFYELVQKLHDAYIKPNVPKEETRGISI